MEKFFTKPNEVEKRSKKEDISKGEFIDFQKMSSEQEEWLRKKIEKNKGGIIVFIHPYYPEENSIGTDIGFGNPEDLKKMRESLSKLLDSKRENNPPILIFHDAEKLDDLRGLLENNLSASALLIGTNSNDPSPKEGNWQELNDKLKSIGVKKVLLAGMNLVVVWPDSDEEPELGGCLMQAAEEFSKEFQVSVSRRVYPNSREDYYAYGGPTGKEK